MVDVVTSTSAAYQADALTQSMSDGQVVYDDQVNQWISDLRSLNEALRAEQPITALWIGSGTGTPDPTADELVVGGTDLTNTGINILTTAAGAGRIVFGDGDDNNVGAFQYQHNFDQFAWTVGGNSELVLSSSYLGPATTGGLDIGRTANRWGTAYINDVRATDNISLASGDPTFFAGDGTGTPDLRFCKADAGNVNLQFMEGGTSTNDRRWIFQFATNEDLAFLRRDGSGGSVDTPLRLNWTTGLVSFDASNSGGLRVPVFANATRGAAGTAGRIIFNTDDGQLNIDDGSNWTLPDGTTT